MDIEGREESENVEDRRGSGGRTAGLAIGGGGGIVVIILALIFGVDPQKFAGMFNQGGGNNGPAVQVPQTDEEKKLEHFAKVIFNDTAIVWKEQFEKMGKTYPKPTLVLFSGETDSGCGHATADVGPFYCPADQKVYIDLAFYKQLAQDLGAPGEFARAYVLAHEVGHHVQNVLGDSKQVDRARGTAEENHMSVRLELQADYLAGCWAYYAGKEFRNYLQPGDVETALNAASKIGDDTLQKRAGMQVKPDRFTHGTSAQRVRWFKAGFETGDVEGRKKLFSTPYDQL